MSQLQPLSHHLPIREVSHRIIFLCHTAFKLFGRAFHHGHLSSSAFLQRVSSQVLFEIWKYFWDLGDLNYSWVFSKSSDIQNFFEIRADFLRSTNILRSQSIFWDLWDLKIFFEIFEISKYFLRSLRSQSIFWDPIDPINCWVFRCASIS